MSALHLTDNDASDATPGNASGVVSLRNVNLVFQQPAHGRMRVLKNISLSLNEGEVVALLGPSGCGKTSLLGIISGLLEPSAGEVVFGQPYRGKSTADFMAMVFQSARLVPWLTVKDNVLFPFLVRRKPISPEINVRAENLLRMVGLEGFQDLYPPSLSGGMMMRVALARALSTFPKLILMDEPLAALDENQRVGLAQEIMDTVDREKSSVLFVTHSVQEAALIADRVLVFSHRPGRIISEFINPMGQARSAGMLFTSEFMDFTKTLREAYQDV